jgi:hypothetical protein
MLSMMCNGPEAADGPDVTAVVDLIENANGNTDSDTAQFDENGSWPEGGVLSPSAESRTRRRRRGRP